MRAFAAVVVLALSALLTLAACRGGAGEARPDGPDATAHAYGAQPFVTAPPPTVDPFVYVSGTNGTYTLDAGYIIGLTCHASDAGATLTITPSGPFTADAMAGTAIPVPNGTSLNLARPVIGGTQNELGIGTVVTFTGTDQYVIWMSLGGT